MLTPRRTLTPGLTSADTGPTMPGMEPPPITATITVEPADDGRVAITLRLDAQSADLLHQLVDDAVISAERQQ